MKKIPNYITLIWLAVFSLASFALKAQANGNGHTIVIDAGHGTVVNGREIEGPTELAIAQKLQKRLIADGYKVIMTRTANGQVLGGLRRGKEYQEQRIRADIANKAGAEMVLSIHSDAHGSDAYHVLYPDTTNPDKYGIKSKHTDGYLNNARAMATKIDTAMVSSGFKTYKSVHGESSNNPEDKVGASKPLMISAHSAAPVITVEVYGHTNPQLVNKYNEDSTRDQVASALQKGVNNYFSPSEEATEKEQSDKQPAQSTAKPADRIDRGENCPPQAPSSGPVAGEDVRPQIAQAFEEALNEASADNQASQKCSYDEKAEQAIVDAAMKFAPFSNGKTRFKYVVGGTRPQPGFNCSGFVDYVLKQAKAAGANIETSSSVLSRSQARLGKVVHKIDIPKFTLASGGAKLRTKNDMPDISQLRKGDLIFFGTSGECPDKKKCPNTIGHVGIYLGDGKFIHSTTSDKDINKDSRSIGNDTSVPPFTSHPQGSLYADYNGVKIDDLYDSYFTPGLYIQVNRIAKEDCSNYAGNYGAATGLGTTANPGGSAATPNFGSCHGRSLCNPGYASHHNTINGYSTGQGDAIDISTDGKVYAAFDGTAVEHHGGPRNDLIGIRLTSAAGSVVADYYHVIPTRTGPVKAGQIIGKLYPLGSGPHIHFELSVAGRIVHGDPSLRSVPSRYVQSLWKNMKTVLGLI